MKPQIQAKNYLEQGFTYYKTEQDFEAALEACETALDLDPDLIEAHNLRGILLEELGRPTDALRAYGRAIKLDPSFVEAQENLDGLKSELATADRLVTIARFSFPTEAYIPQAKLKAEGIEAFILGFDNVANTSGGLLQVKEEEVERAIEILTQESDIAEWDDEDFIIPEEAEGEEKPDEPETSPDFEIAGFWRRLAAFILDGIILAIPLLIFGFVFRDLAFRLGPWGRLVGFSLVWLYWSLMSSNLRGGQTVGKRVMHIAVVDKQGDYLTLGQAMARAFILVIIGLLNGWALSLLENPIAMAVASTIIFGGGLALLYGLVFNRTTRQGIHDLLVNSYVIKMPLPSEVTAPRIPPIHQRISYGLVVLGLVIGLGGAVFQQSNTNPTLGILEEGEWGEIMNLYQTLSANNEFFSASVRRNNRFQMGASGDWKELRIEIWVKKSCERDHAYCLDVMKRVARTALEEYEGIEKLNGMQIIIVNRFDLGIASGHFTMNNALTIDDWHEQLSP